MTSRPVADLALEVGTRPLRRIRLSVSSPDRLTVQGRLFPDEVETLKAHKATLIDFIEVFSPLRLRAEDAETIRTGQKSEVTR